MAVAQYTVRKEDINLWSHKTHDLKPNRRHKGKIICWEKIKWPCSMKDDPKRIQLKYEVSDKALCQEVEHMSNWVHCCWRSLTRTVYKGQYPSLLCGLVPGFTGQTVTAGIPSHSQIHHKLSFISSIYSCLLNVVKSFFSWLYRWLLVAINY